MPGGRRTPPRSTCPAKVQTPCSRFGGAIQTRPILQRLLGWPACVQLTRNKSGAGGIHHWLLSNPTKLVDESLMASRKAEAGKGVAFRRPLVRVHAAPVARPSHSSRVPQASRVAPDLGVLLWR
jgi:hypothetical protein